MAWIGVELEDTLVQEDDGGNMSPLEGAVDIMHMLTNEGHRLTVLTTKFAPVPETRKRDLKEKLEQSLITMGFPETMEVWAGSTRPKTDLNLGFSNVTFDNDWGLALAQLQFMLEERGLIPPPMADDGSTGELDGMMQEEEQPLEKQQPEEKPKEAPKKDSKPEKKPEKKEKK